ncbi:hypothetical protein CLOP_g12871 [Closterium sp. NIES-67]|nr:hypothetical protein CLOP_g12871 [Closterium sp. NIES-67]
MALLRPHTAHGIASKPLLTALPDSSPLQCSPLNDAFALLPAHSSDHVVSRAIWPLTARSSQSARASTRTSTEGPPFLSSRRQHPRCPGTGIAGARYARYATDAHRRNWRAGTAFSTSENSGNADESEPLIIEDADCVVVGAGVSGLSAAFALVTKHAATVPRVLVTEARDRVGGNVTTVEGEAGTEREGYVWEEGPHSFQPSDAMLQCALDCGILPDLCSELLTLPATSFGTASLRPIPSGPGDLISSDLITLGGKLRAALGFAGVRVAQAASSTEESVSEFVSRILGPQLLHRLVDPFCSCIFAGDAAQMSMRAAFNRIWRMEAEGGLAAEWNGAAGAGETKAKESAAPRNPRLPKPQANQWAPFDQGSSLSRVPWLKG